MGAKRRKHAKDGDNKDESTNYDSEEWKKQIVSMLQGANDDGGSSGSLPVKKLRRMVFLSVLQQDDEDDDDNDNDDNKNQRKVAKKKFKKTVQTMETEGIVSLNADGIITLLQHCESEKQKKKRKKEEKKSKKKTKRQRTDAETGDDDDDDGAKKNPKDLSKQIKRENDNDNDDDSSGAASAAVAKTSSDDDKKKNQPCPGNPQGITRLFLGNLPFAIDDKGLDAFFAPSIVTHIQWITDKATGKFYGSAFIEMDNSESAARAVQKAGTSLSGRPIKVNFAPARPGDVWPPPTKIVTGGGDSNKATTTTTSMEKPDGGMMSEKPDGCVKLFVGNLSYEIDDDKLIAFFSSVNAEVKAIRWQHHKETGDFKGVGFVEFWNTEACDKAATLNGKNLLGRKIRIDWTD